MHDDGSYVKIILYRFDPVADYFESMMQSLVSEFSGEEFYYEDLRQHVREFPVKKLAQVSVLGYIELQHPDDPCNGAKEVVHSAAKSGYGPLMYDIAMSVSNGGIVSDRMSVSDDAMGVWDYYMNNRSDVEAHPLDDAEDPKTPPPGDDCGFHHPDFGDDENLDLMSLNHSYTGDPVDVESLMDEGELMSRHLIDVFESSDLNIDPRSARELTGIVTGKPV